MVSDSGVLPDARTTTDKQSASLRKNMPPLLEKMAAERGRKTEGESNMYNTKFFPDDLSVSELTVEQYKRAIETCSTSTMKIGSFDPDVLIDFISKVASVQEHGEEVEIVAIRNDISKCGSLIAVIYTSPTRYVGIAGMKDKE